MAREPWNADIREAKEGKRGETLSDADRFGNYTYKESGTYGQSDFTVRKRDNDDTSDLYVYSDSGKLHSHDHIDKDGNLLDKYHDCLLSMYQLREDLISELNSQESQMKLIKK